MRETAARLAAVLAALLFASVGSQAAEKVSIYAQGVAAVEETQTLPLNAGVNQLSFSVPSLLIPESVHVEVDGTVLSQAFFFTPAETLLSASIGKEIELVTKDGYVFRGTLLATGDPLALRDSAGKIQLVSNVAEITLADSALHLSPTLNLSVRNDSSGPVPLDLLYLTGGLSWEASYVAILDAPGATLSLDGGILLANKSGKDFLAASVRLVAGELNMAAPGEGNAATVAPKSLASSSFTEQSAFEYHVYSLVAPVDLTDGTSFLLPYAASRSVAVEKQYTYDGARASGVSVLLHFANTDENGLGIPLPAGTIRLFQKDETGTLFIGEDAILHTPKDERISVRAGAAFDLVGERVQVSRELVSQSTYRDCYRVTLRNHKTEAVQIAVLEHLPGSTWRILTSSPSYESVDSSTVRFLATVAPGGDSEVTYTVEYSY